MFDVDPSQIVALDAKDLVLLLGRLLHAEAQVAGVPLSGIAVPLQITVPDGGEDGRITWTDGKDCTDYLPGRITYFQCKATKLGRQGWKKECWVKSTQRKGKARKLTSALISLVAQGGCYVGFTTEAITGEKRDDYIAGIREAIVEADGDPTKLGKIELYDANRIAAWAIRHPAVSIWLAEKVQGQSLGGFRTVESWGTRADFGDAYADDSDSRYAIGRARERDSSGADNRTTAKVAWARILEHISEPGKLVRVVGTSGLGKSRFVYESLASSTSQLNAIVHNSTVFAEYKAVSTILLPVATRLAEAGQRTLLVIDECPRDIAVELGKLAAQSGSLLSVVTIDTDDEPLEEGSSLHISLSPSGEGLIEAIIRKKNPSLNKGAVERLREICGGFPRFAVLAAGSFNGEASVFETADDVVDRILKGAKITDPEEVRALQCLSCESRRQSGQRKRSDVLTVAE